MAKKCPVRSLADNSLAELANFIVSTINYSIQNSNITATVNNYQELLEHNINITMININQYFQLIGATNTIYQDLLHIILNSDRLEPLIRLICLQMLLNSNTKYLVTNIFPYSYYENILQIIAIQGTKLCTLNLKGVWVKDEHIHYLINILKNCQYLRKLYIPYIANDEILDIISKYLPNLYLLDICGITDITEIGIEYLASGLCMTNLTIIDIGIRGEENICYTDIAIIIQNCINIETLGTYSYVGKSLQYIHNDLKLSKFQTKLKYIHDVKTNNTVLEIIRKMCPYLENLYLDLPLPNILDNLKNIKLCKLKINTFQCNELMKLLKISGNYLKHLTLIKGNGYLDLNQLAENCIQLIDLDCYMMENLIFHNLNYNKFEKLQSLEILHSTMTIQSIKNFLMNTIHLKRLAIDTFLLTDDEFIAILIEHDFYQLEDVWFTTAPNLTVLSIEILMERCPELQSIGQLSGWDLTTDDIELIRGILKSGNSSLILSPNHLFP